MACGGSCVLSTVSAADVCMFILSGRRSSLSLSFLRVFLNVCFSYASRYEIADTIQSLVEGSHHGTLLPR